MPSPHHHPPPPPPHSVLTNNTLSHHPPSPSHDTRLSKTLSYILRHGASRAGLSIDSRGYVKLADLLQQPQLRGRSISDIQRVVTFNDKQRFLLKHDKLSSEWFIKATQGHSIKDVTDTSELVRLTTQLPLLIHGTYTQHLPSILSLGLSRQNRNYIHLATSTEARSTMMRRDCDVVVVIDMGRALGDGVGFFQSENGVVLTEGVGGVLGREYFKCIQDRSGRVIWRRQSGWVSSLGQQEQQEQQEQQQQTTCHRTRLASPARLQRPSQTSSGASSSAGGYPT